MADDDKVVRIDNNGDYTVKRIGQTVEVRTSGKLVVTLPAGLTDDDVARWIDGYVAGRKEGYDLGMANGQDTLRVEICRLIGAISAGARPEQAN